VVPRPGVLRQRAVARHRRDGRRVADEPGRPLRRPAPLVHGTGRRGHRGLLHPDSPDRGRGHLAGDHQVRLRRRRHDLVDNRRLPRLPAAAGDHRDRGHRDDRGRPDGGLRPARRHAPGASGPAGASGAAASDPAAGVASHAAQIADLLAAVEEGREPAVGGADGRAALEIVLAVYESARSGGPVLIGARP